MALYRLKLTQNTFTGVTGDRATMQWGFSYGAAPSVADLTAIDTAWAAALNATVASGTFKSLLATGLSPYLWEAFPAAGGAAVAVFAAAAASRAGTGSNAMPTQVALCCSQLVVTTRGSRPIGRTYYGPFGTGAGSSSTSRPATATVTRLLAMAVALHNAMVARGWTPVVLNAAGSASRGNVVGYQVDDAWDTVRSRGLNPQVYSTQAP